MRLRRNQKPPKGYEQSRHWQPFFITISSGLEEANKGEFWDLSCIRKGESLVLKEAHLVDKTPYIKKPALTLVNTNTTVLSNSNGFFKQPETTEAHLIEKTPTVKKPTSTLVPSPSSTQSNFNLSSTKVIMIEGKQPEITVKFSTRPDLSEVGKVVILKITSEQGLSVRANLNRKTLKKQVEKMDTFTDWIAALSGKIARIDPNGVIELEAASVVVFEKKAKEESVSEVDTEVQKSASVI